MAKAKTKRFGEIVIEVEQTMLAGDWSKPCGVRTKGYNRTNTMGETIVSDCDDEDLPAEVERDIESRSGEISLAGALDAEQLDLWDDWDESGVTKRVRVTIPGTGAEGGRTYIRPFKLASYNITAERGKRWEYEATLQSDGPQVRVNAA